MHDGTDDDVKFYIYYNVRIGFRDEYDDESGDACDVLLYLNIHKCISTVQCINNGVYYL